MGRTPFLTTLAWGRSIWAAQGEDQWNREAQTSQSAAQVSSQASEEDHDASQQRQDSNSKLVKSEAYNNARERRRAANNILTVIGVVESTRYGAETAKNAERESYEQSWFTPVFVGAGIGMALATRWIANVTFRLQAASWSNQRSLVEQIVEDYRLLGPMQFFFAGAPASYFEAPFQPQVFTEEFCYWILRAVCANVSSRELRQIIIRAQSWIEKGYDVILEFVDFPIRLNIYLQQLGLIRSFGIFPGIGLLVSVLNCIRTPSKTSLPLFVAFLHGIIHRQVTNRCVWPHLEQIVISFHQSRMPKTIVTASGQHALESGQNAVTMTQALSSNFTGENIASSSPQPSRLSDNIDRSSRANRTDESTRSRGMTLLFDDDTNTASSDQTESEVDIALSVVPIEAQESTQDVISAQNASTQQVEDGPQLRIDIAAHQGANGATIQELNINLAENVNIPSTTNPAVQQPQDPVPGSFREDLPLANVPLMYMNIVLLAETSLLLWTPIDRWVLSGLVDWWISTSDTTDQVGQQLLGRVPGAFISTFAMDRSSLLWNSLRWSNKYILSIAIRTVLSAGVWAAQAEAVIWLGRRYFGWPLSTNS